MSFDCRFPSPACLVFCGRRGSLCAAQLSKFGKFGNFKACSDATLQVASDLKVAFPKLPQDQVWLSLLHALTARFCRRTRTSFPQHPQLLAGAALHPISALKTVSVGFSQGELLVFPLPFLHSFSRSRLSADKFPEAAFPLVLLI